MCGGEWTELSRCGMWTGNYQKRNSPIMVSRSGGSASWRRLMNGFAALASVSRTEPGIRIKRDGAATDSNLVAQDFLSQVDVQGPHAGRWPRSRAGNGR